MTGLTDISRRPITAKEVARLAGVSQSAVSRTFTQGASVAPATRERVRQAAAQLGYRPNLLARSLITRRSNLIGVIVPSLDNPFYAQVLEQLSAAFEPFGYRILLFSTANHEDSDPVLEEVLSYRVEALILVSASLSSSFAEQCHAIGLPVVLFNRRIDNDNISSVTSDNVIGARIIAAFLLAADHRHIAFIAGKPTSSTGRDRLQAFHETLEAAGREAPATEIGGFSFEGGATAARCLLTAQPQTDAIFCANDVMALAAIGVASQEFGRQVGKDLSIVGFDDIAVSAWPTFALTTYVQQVERMVERTVRIIRDQLKHPDSHAVTEIISGHLIVRDSSRVPAHGVVMRDGYRIWQP